MPDAYLILCHDNPQQLNALSSHLAGAGHDVYIHLDAASMLEDCIRQTERIHLLPEPELVRWGSWSICAATLKLMRAAAHSGKKYRYIHQLSGQCFPAMPMERLDAALGDWKPQQALQAAHALEDALDLMQDALQNVMT